ncbi:hypothetical protein DL93DRAFT_2082378 [Clavulina sp. PMI_390]|nr:hypothetical protein DL93DRAFT_2082378 [Clavulina sp. PMI_390]
MTIYLLSPPSLRQGIPPQIQRMVECLVDAHLSTIHYLCLRSSTQPLVQLFQAWPALRAVVIHQYEPYRATVPPNLLPDLCRIQAYLPWLEQLVPGRPIEQMFVSPTSFERERSPEYIEAFKRTLSQCPGLKHLRVHQIPVPGERLMLNFSHSGITTLDLVLCPHEALTEEEATSLVTVAFHGIIRELPALCTLRVIYVHHKLPGSVEFPPPLDDASTLSAQFIDACRTAFDELLRSTRHRALQLIRVEICSSTSNIPDDFWIDAKRRNSLEWVVQAGIGNGKKLSELAVDDD